jgi:RNA polymerase sigma factor (sigma-70 family)
MIMGHTVGELVGAARAGEQWAWDELVERYVPLVQAVTRGFRLNAADSLDVSQTVFLRLVERLDELRVPEALPGWIVTTAKNESIRLLKLGQRCRATDPSSALWQDRDMLDTVAGVDEVGEELLRAERRQALREALAQLKPRHRDLLLLLLCDPPLTYDQISDRLQMPKGSIGPTRARALSELRRAPALQALLPTSETGSRK